MAQVRETQRWQSVFSVLMKKGVIREERGEASCRPYCSKRLTTPICDKLGV
jgi:hypothetical protein